eukprot:664688_1
MAPHTDDIFTLVTRSYGAFMPNRVLNCMSLTVYILFAVSTASTTFIPLYPSNMLFAITTFKLGLIREGAHFAIAIGYPKLSSNILPIHARYSIPWMSVSAIPRKY